MIRFVPAQLSAARARVVEAHPFSLDDFSRLESIEDTAVGARVERALRATTPETLVRVASSMTRLELRVCGGFLAHSEHVVRMAAFGVLQQAPDVVSPTILWEALRQWLEEPEGLAAAEMLLRLAPIRSIDVRRLQIAQMRLDGPERVGVGLWNAVTLNGSTPTEVRDSLRTSGSSLERVLDRTLLSGDHPRSAEWWAIHTEDEFSRVYGRADADGALAAFLAGFQLAEAASVGASRMDGPVAFLVDAFDRDRSLRERLREVDPDAWEWWKNEHALRALQSFFGDRGDNERFDFWRRWVPRTTRILGSVESGRLLLDFGDFGVVEFAETGNATYVYEADMFARMWRRHEFDPGESHYRFKDREAAIDRLTHHRNWQPGFDHLLNTLLAHQSRGE